MLKIQAFVQKEMDTVFYMEDQELLCNVLENGLDAIYVSSIESIDRIFKDLVPNYNDRDFVYVMNNFENKALSKEMMSVLKPHILPYIKKLNKITAGYIELSDYRASLAKSSEK